MKITNIPPINENVLFFVYFLNLFVYNELKENVCIIISRGKYHGRTEIRKHL